MHLLCHTQNLPNILILRQKPARKRLILRCGCSFLKPSVRKRTVAPGRAQNSYVKSTTLVPAPFALTPTAERGLALFDCCRRLWLSVKTRQQTNHFLRLGGTFYDRLDALECDRGSTLEGCTSILSALTVPLPPQPPSRRPPAVDPPSGKSPRFSRLAHCDRLEPGGRCRRTHTITIAAWPRAFSRQSKEV